MTGMAAMILLSTTKLLEKLCLWYLLKPEFLTTHYAWWSKNSTATIQSLTCCAIELATSTSINEQKKYIYNYSGGLCSEGENFNPRHWGINLEVHLWPKRQWM